MTMAYRQEDCEGRERRSSIRTGLLRLRLAMTSGLDCFGFPPCYVRGRNDGDIAKPIKNTDKLSVES
ncbi:MAG: hypothetical protein A2X77_05760 [Gammaproteobacteria bacterium GWE2_42_36]|nr:MAG: hypothetical protein A2X77_05760 [Gammaproteobacteria bacterium GWE2_42_36]